MRKIIIIMSVLNGEKFLTEQLKSIEAQNYKNWDLIVSDDGSTDGSKEIIVAFKEKWGEERVQVRKGPRQGFCMNFLSIVSDPEINGDYFVFSDQDDVWLPDKLDAALEFAAANEVVGLPFLYGGRTTYVDLNLKYIEMSPPYIFPCSFRNALIQNIFGGNTILFNKKAKALVEKTGPVNAPFHDWWMYIIVSGAGGIVVYDIEPHVLYRQHSKAVVGSGHRITDRLRRVLMLLNGRFKKWSKTHIELLNKNSELLTFESRQILKNFEILRSERIARRFRMLEVCGLYRQTFRATITLYLAILFKKI